MTARRIVDLALDLEAEGHSPGESYNIAVHPTRPQSIWPIRGQQVRTMETLLKAATKYPGTIAYERDKAERMTTAQRVDIAWQAVSDCIVGGLNKEEYIRLARLCLIEADLDVLADAVALEALR